MKFFLYYEYGGCNDGDHTCELEIYDSENEAQEKIKEIMSEQAYHGNVRIKLIAGELLEEYRQ